MRVLPFLVSVVGFTLAAVYVTNNSNFGSVAAAIHDLTWATSFFVLALFVVASLLASLRLWLIARDIGSPILGRDAVAALSVGSLAGALFFQVMGQIIARSTLLSRRGTPVAATLVMSGYERALAAVVSLSLGAAGAWFLYGKLSLDLQHGGAELLKLLGAMMLAVGAGAYLGWGGIAAKWLAKKWSATLLSSGVRNLAISAGIQLCTMAAYLLAARQLTPDLGLLDVAAAAAVVMLAASLPISFAGWGIRELSAILALGAIGMPKEKALVVALLAGTMSLTALALVLAASYIPSTSRRALEQHRMPTIARPDFATALAWILPLAAATAVFFQIHLPTAEGVELNVNLADPLAIVAGTLFVLAAISGRKLPDWRVARFNEHLVAATLVMMFGLFSGFLTFGWTAWAFISKFMGWFVLLAYGATGALVASTAGRVGRHALLRTFIATGIAIAAVEIALIELRHIGVSLDLQLAPIRASGFAANPNAFAFQMALVGCASLVIIRSNRLAAVLLSVALAAIWLSASRAGLVAMAMALAISTILLPQRRTTIVYSLILAAALVALLVVGIALSKIEVSSNEIGSAFTAPLVLGPPAVSTDASNNERWQTMLGGISLFWEYPIFGAGLGAFAESWRQVHGHVQVIHSTPLWLLAEFGLVGAAIIVLPFVCIVLYSFAGAMDGRETAILTLLCCVVLASMALVHELLYQRSFWLLLGAAAALDHGALPWPSGVIKRMARPFQSSGAH
jgi:hypothetical protein